MPERKTMPRDGVSDVNKICALKIHNVFFIVYIILYIKEI